MTAESLSTSRSNAASASSAATSDVTPRALLLDFGCVISVSAFEKHRQTEKQLNLEPGSLTWLGPLDPETDPLWASMQRDEITEREYWAIRARELGTAVGESNWDMPTMLSRLRHTDPNNAVRPEMRRLILRARAGGIRVGMLSNEFELFYGTGMLGRLDVLREMDAIVDATHTKILKPDPRSYQLALEALRLPAREVLFVDDQFRNIAGAVHVGLQTQYFDLRDVAGNIAAIAARLKLSFNPRLTQAKERHDSIHRAGTQSCQREAPVASHGESHQHARRAARHHRERRG